MRKLLAASLIVVAAGIGAYFYFFPNFKVPRFAGEAIQKASDVATTTKVKSAFALSKRLSAYEIGVDTRDGVVTLAGKVPTEIDKELAEAVAKDINGVERVESNLSVEPGLKPSEESARESVRVADLEIRADLLERLAASPDLKGKNLQISVQDRVVTISGEVDRPHQKSGAEQLARSISNVSGVVNNLAVKDATAAQSEVPGIPEQAARDKELSRQVAFAIFNERDNFANAGAIKTESKDGAVTLTGTVASRAERALAERIAREVKGVQNVNNLLAVTSPAR